MKKKLLFVWLLVLYTFVLAGCGGPEATYKQAQELMAGGKYAEAAEKLEGIGSYEDSTTLAMYCKAVALGESGQYREAASAFSAFADYKDSRYMMQYYTARAYEEENEPISAICAYREIPLFLDSQTRAEQLLGVVYNEGIAYAEKGDFAKAYSTMEALNQIAAYQDSKELQDYYDVRSREAGLLSTEYAAQLSVAKRYDALGTYSDSATRAENLRKTVYDAAGEALANQEYDTAIELFTALEGYSDAGTQVQMSHYQKAEALLAAKDYDGASEAFTKAGTYSDAQSRIREPYYVQAQDLLAAGKYADAYAAFSTITGYRDVDTLLKDEKLLAGVRQEILDRYRVGNKVTLGTYDGQALIWQVLAVEENKVLLMTENTLETRAYHEKYENTTWEECSLRTWLNGSFLDSVFTAEEQESILLTDVKAEKETYWGGDAGNDTQDQVFLLSISEMEQYFKTESDRICRNSSGFAMSWWLRSPGRINDLAACVNFDGKLNAGYVDGAMNKVRPALWLNLESFLP